MVDLYFGEKVDKITYLKVIDKFDVRFLENISISIFWVLRDHKESIDSEECTKLLIKKGLFDVSS